jgi:hypothetical protein
VEDKLIKIIESDKFKFNEKIKNILKIKQNKVIKKYLIL